MSVRSFAVFQDTPVDTPPLLSPKPLSSSSRQTLGSIVTALNNADGGSSLLSPTIEKENVHPVTGLVPTTASQANKKRKTSTSTVLATKLHAPITITEESSLGKGKRPEMKTRRSTSSSAASSAGKTKASGSSGKKASGSKDKERRVLGQSSSDNSSAGHFNTMPRTRAASRRALAAVAETEEATVAQAHIDSRCYELTVLPLADVSTAYLQTSEGKSPAPTEKDATEAVTPKETDFEARMKDYFSAAKAASSPTTPSAVNATSAPTTPKPVDDHFPGFTVFCDVSLSLPESATPATEPVVRETNGSEAVLQQQQQNEENNGDGEDEGTTPQLSTPERKSLYTAFTFSSPVQAHGQ
ncbi:hypothetical protein BD410DRAFT_839499 [Rickenella mellea]|uniref:Uncharacterized protein n=1 Tax=Rickenella mellea TaxID=50990 RepID=A0A4Y7Q5V9_9AGAM|nr:hypothetical protein BD410DRAFT_839499 [Rickenella mellea]